jgi:Kef-type K+ transport system membrane component KefB
LLWVILAIATGLVKTETSSASEIASTILLTLLFFGIALFVMPRVVGYASTLRWNLVMRSSSAGYILFICFLFAAFASFLDVNIVFGALLAGIVVGILPQEKLERARSNVKQTSLGLFIPLYFALVGLKLNLIRDFDLQFFLLFLVFTTIIQMLGTLITARVLGLDWLSSFNLGTAMSTRGGPGIVLATVAYDLGIINEVFFVAMVLTAIVTSLLAGTWFRFVLRKGWHLMSDQGEETKPV